MQNHKARIQHAYPLKIGMKVLRPNAKKKGRNGGRMEKDFFGPYVIVELHGKKAKLQDLKTGKTLARGYSVDHLKEYKEEEALMNSFGETDEDKTNVLEAWK